MNRYVRQIQRLMKSRQGRQVVASRAFVVALVSALLLVPTTCAQVMGPHSIFLDTTASHLHHVTETTEDDGGYASASDLEWHVVNGNGSPAWALSDEQSADDDCPTRPRLRDLPSTMSMSSVGAPMSLEIAQTLDLPIAGEPVARDASAPCLVIRLIDSPPPR